MGLLKLAFLYHAQEVGTLPVQVVGTSAMVALPVTADSRTVEMCTYYTMLFSGKKAADRGSEARRMRPIVQFIGKTVAQERQTVEDGKGGE